MRKVGVRDEYYMVIKFYVRWVTSAQQPPRERAGCERIIVVLVHAVPCDVGGAITGGLASCVDCSRS